MDSASLLYRPFKERDWKAVHAYAAMESVSRYQQWGPNTEEQTKAYIADILKSEKENPRSRFVFTLWLKEEEKLIGAAEYQQESWENACGVIGYVLHPDYWGRGCATEAAKTMIAFGFNNLKAHRIYATCDARNLASARVLEKSGMQYEGKLRGHMKLRDGWRDSLVYSVLNID